MCPYFSDVVCALKKDEDAVPDNMKVYYCKYKQFPDAYKNRPTYKSEERYS